MSGETIRVPVTGMTCGSCVNRITRSVGRLDGVTKVSVDLRRETATVRRDPDVTPDSAIAAAVASAGYTADLARLEVLPEVAGSHVGERLRVAIRRRLGARP